MPGLGRMTTLLPSAVPLDNIARIELIGYLRGVLSADGIASREDYLHAYGHAADAQTVRNALEVLGT